MKFTDERHLSPAARVLRRRILEALPAGGYQLDRLFQLFDIEVTDAVATAAVTTGGATRLCVNPGFVARYCVTDESLFVLVLHELLHVVLGHTRLFARSSWARNVAFDAVINATIARSHPQPAYLELLTSVNGWTTFPGRLLRPAPGWPQQPEPLPADASEQERSIHARLYSEKSGDVTYHEIFALLQSFLDAERKAGRVPRAGLILLGGHGGAGRDAADDWPDVEVIDPTLLAVLKAIESTWPAAMRSLGGAAQDVSLAANQASDRALTQALGAVFAKAGCGRPGRLGLRATRVPVASTAISVLPQPGDRRAPTRRAVLGRPPIFWEAPQTRMVRGRLPAPRAFVYLDVSGSMSAFLPALRAAIAGPVRDGAARLFAFSTEVHEVNVRTFGHAAARSTGGTEVNAVLTHLLGLPAPQRPRAVVLVTDGLVGKPHADLVQRLQQLRLAVHIALAPNGRRDDLASIASVFHELPAPSAGTATQQPMRASA